MGRRLVGGCLAIKTARMGTPDSSARCQKKLDPDLSGVRREKGAFNCRTWWSDELLWPDTTGQVPKISGTPSAKMEVGRRWSQRDWVVLFLFLSYNSQNSPHE